MCERCTELEADNAAMRAALEDARHALTTLNGLWATDDIHAYDDALSEGLDANAARDCMMKKCWQIDEAKVLATIDAALAPDAGRALAARLARLERVAQAARRYRAPNNSVATWQQAATALDDALAALEPGDG